MLALMLLVYSIPKKYLQSNKEYSVAILESEGNHNVILDTDNAKLDNYTDKMKIHVAAGDSTDTLIDSSMAKYYPRYWHGYAITLRPLLCFFNIYHIRYIVMFAFIVLFSVCICLMSRELGSFYSLSFCIALAMSNIFLVSSNSSAEQKHG